MASKFGVKSRQSVLAAICAGLIFSTSVKGEDGVEAAADTTQQAKVEQLQQEADQARQDAMRAQMEADQLRQEAAKAKQESEELRQQSEIIGEAKSDAALYATNTTPNAEPIKVNTDVAATPVEATPYERPRSDHPMLDYFKAGTFTDYLIWGYIAISTILGLFVVYRPMMNWYKRQFIFVHAGGMVEVFFKRLALKFNWLLFVLACAAVIGSLGGNIYAIFKLRQKRPIEEVAYSRGGAEM